MKKRIISGLLAFVMSCSLALSMTCLAVASSAPYSDFDDLTAKEEETIEDVVSLGIMKGDGSGNFRPNSPITKAEAVCIALRLMGYSNTYVEATSKFLDVPKDHWANQSISLASNIGLAVGSDNRFEPDKSLTGIELMTMCLRVIGIGEALDKTGNWPSSHMQFINNNNIIKGNNKSIYNAVNRLEAAEIVSQFINTNIWVKNAKTGIYEKSDDTLISKNLDAEYYESAIVTDIDEARKKVDLLCYDNEKSKKNKNKEKEYNKELEYLSLPSSFDLDDLNEGDVVNVSVKGSRILKIETESDTSDRSVIYDSVTSFDSSSGVIRLEVDGKEKTYHLSEELLIVDANGTKKTGTKDNMTSAKRLIERTIKDYLDYDEDDDEDFDDNTITGKLILNDEDKIISITVSAYEKIIYVDEVKDEKIDGYSASKYHSKNAKTYLNLRKESYEIRDTSGHKLDIDDIDRDDVILTNNKDPYVILKLDEPIYGKIQESDDDDDDRDYIIVNDEKYYRNTKFCSSWPSESSTKRKIWLDQNDKVVGWK